MINITFIRSPAIFRDTKLKALKIQTIIMLTTIEANFISIRFLVFATRKADIWFRIFEKEQRERQRTVRK